MTYHYLLSLSVIRPKFVHTSWCKFSNVWLLYLCKLTQPLLCIVWLAVRAALAFSKLYLVVSPTQATYYKSVHLLITCYSIILAWAHIASSNIAHSVKSG